MKKAILSLLLACSSMNATWAVKAWPFPVEVAQSDGTTLTIMGHGDEHFHYFTTTDGVVLARQGSDYMVATILPDGTISASAVIAHNAESRSEAERTAIASQDKSLLAKRESEAREQVLTRASSVKSSYASYPWKASSSPRVLVILAQFPDMPFHTTETINGQTTQLDAKTIFEQYLNATGSISPEYGTVSKNHGSVKQYFSDMSGGAFNPQFDIYGPVTLSKSYTVYGKGEGTDNMSEFVPEVCSLANKAGVDFSKYDMNNDGYVDLVYIIYAGWGENMSGNSSSCIWPKSGTVSGGTYNGKRVVLYGVNNEMCGNDITHENPTMWINGIGTFCHEFSHCLGLPDIYTTTEASESVQVANNQSMGFYDLMDLGNFVDNSYTPKAYTALERELMGWQQMDNLTQSGTYSLQCFTDGGKALRMRNPKNSNEYMVVENLQNKGWDCKSTYLGHGLLAYHVEYDADIFAVLSGNSKNNTVNNTAGHPRVAIVPADGRMLNQNNPANTTSNLLLQEQRGDTFGSGSQSGITELNDDLRLPNYLFYTSSTNGKTNMALKNITENTDGTVSFDFNADVASGIGHTPTVTDPSDAIYTLYGTFAGYNFDQLPKGIYVWKGKKIKK